MTSNELLLKHVAKCLGHYKGNLHWLLEAADNGHVPAADDETIRPHVQELKRYMGIETTSLDDEFLLRFGLIVPGLFRGIHPPVVVLEPERGGFSAKRLKQAADQVRRLQEALRLGRRYFTDLPNDTIKALRQLAVQLHTDDTDDGWMHFHGDLPDTEARMLAVQAFASLDDKAIPSDLGKSILACLANFRRDGLGTQTTELLRRDLFWPSSIYRDAPDDVARGLVDRIPKADRLQLNHLLLALAWTRGEFARRTFLEWRNTPPAWSGSLHVRPEDYLNVAGWTIDAAGKRRELISLSSHKIEQIANKSAARVVVPCRTETEKRCPSCAGFLVWLFDFTKLPDDFFSADRTDAPRRVLCCLDCSCFCPAMFSRYQPDGSAELHPATHCEESSNFGGRPASARELILTPRPPFAAADAFGIDDATGLGGVPMWLQDAQYPHCPECNNVMKFLAQFDNGSMTPPEEGIYYSFFCPECRVAAVNYQQT